MFCLYTSRKLSRPKSEFSLKVKVMGSNADYLLKYFLLYHIIRTFQQLRQYSICFFSFRYYDYSLQKAELFMLDFCYFVNFSVVLQTAFFPDNLLWFKANYVLCMGPICIAIMVWKNSLVFHSLDKLTSFFLHAFPTMVSTYSRNWKTVTSKPHPRQ